MEIIIPKQYSPIYGGVLYTIQEADPKTIIDTDIINPQDNTIIGRKKLKGQTEYRINTASYAKSYAFIEPLSKRESGIYGLSSRRPQSVIEVSGTRYSTTHTAGSKPSELGTVMSDTPTTRYIAIGQQDEISILFDNDIYFLVKTKQGNNIVEKDSMLNNKDISIFTLSTEIEGLTANDFPLTAEISLHGKPTVVVTYHLCNAEDTVRIAWVNQYGAIDFYNFYTDAKLSVDKNGRTEVNLYTPPITKEYRGWLSQIIASDRVWIENNGGFTPAVISSDKIEIDKDEAKAIKLSLKFG